MEIQLLGIAVQTILIASFGIFLFWKGPNGRFARLRCAWHGEHYWDTKVDIKPDPENKMSIQIVATHRCLVCQECLDFKASLGVEPIPPEQVVDGRNN